MGIEGFIAGLVVLLSWLCGFFCCWKMQVDHERIKRKYLRTDADIAKETNEKR